MPLVEIIGGKRTSAEAIDWAMAFPRHLGKESIKLNTEANGHMTNRLQFALIREAVACLLDGIANAQNIDKAVRYGLAPRWALMGSLAAARRRGSDPSRPPGVCTRARSRSGPGSRSPPLRGNPCVGKRGAGALAQPAQPARKPCRTEPVAAARPRRARAVPGPHSREDVQRSGQAHGPSGGSRRGAIHRVSLTVLAQLAQRELHRP